MLKYLILGLTLSSSFLRAPLVWASPTTFSYDVRIPSTQRSCADEASFLGQNFQQVTGLQVSAAVCTAETHFTPQGEKSLFDLYSISVSYVADKEAARYVAQFGYDRDSNIPNDINGAYDTYSDCLADIENHKNIFPIQQE